MSERELPRIEAPQENYNYGLKEVEIPELGPAIKGKVRDSWIIPGALPLRVMVTTDRQSAFNYSVGNIPGKGKILNLISAYNFSKTRDIIPNQIVSVPHPNVTIAKEASATLPVEVVVRGYMAKSSSPTSIYRNYTEGRRNIYGINFPDGIRPYEKLPMGTIITPTTKSENDEELNDEQASELVDRKLGDGVWKAAKEAAVKIFDKSSEDYLQRGLILADTKYEFGLDQEGKLMIIDEMHSPDSSRFWLKETYEDKLANGDSPENFDKEILRNWLAQRGFTGEGQQIPILDVQIVHSMSNAYKTAFRMITGHDVPDDVPSSAVAIRASVLQFLSSR